MAKSFRAGSVWMVDKLPPKWRSLDCGAVEEATCEPLYKASERSQLFDRWDDVVVALRAITWCTR
jgi:hypothetical protein